MSLVLVLALIIYLGLIPLIVLAAMVMAVRRRQVLGPRASGLLFAGAGFLLVGQAFIALRPLLRDVIARQDLAVLGGVADLINALSLIQFGLQAAGIGLIVVAVFVTRQNVLSIPSRRDQTE